MATLILKAPGSDQSFEIEIGRHGANRPAAFTYRRNHCHAEFEVEQSAPGSGWLRLRGAVVPFHSVRKAGMLHVWAAGRVHAFEIVERTAQRATGGTDKAGLKSTLTAPMPGTILKINLAAGEPFTDHQPLIIMESMKMEMTLSVPHSGRVKEVTCRVGQLVEMGALLARLEPTDEAAP